MTGDLAAHRASDTAASGWRQQLIWFVGGAVGAFFVPLVASSALDLHHDLYLLFYFGFVGALLVRYMRASEIRVGEVVRRHWHWSLLVGLILLVPVIRNVLSEDSTPRPDGAYFVFELIWRGAIYGAFDALLLTVFPCLVVFTALRRDLGTIARKLGYAAGSLGLILVITATYHLGYEQYREDGVSQPEIGNVIFSVPMLVTANPVGSVLDHSAMHVAAVVHEYEGKVRLPPATTADGGEGR